MPNAGSHTKGGERPVRSGGWRRKKITAIVLAVVAVISFLFFGWRPNELRYEGKTVLEWAQTFHSEPDKTAAERALRALGREAIPDLLRGLRMREMRHKTWLRALVAKLAPAREAGFVRTFRLYEPALVRAASAQALGWLLPDDPRVVRALGRAVEDPDRRVAGFAALALSRMGAKGLPELEQRLDHKTELTRSMAVYGMHMAGPQATNAVSALIERLNDSDLSVARQSAVALGQIGPAAVEPLLQGLADKKRPPVLRARYALGLASVGPQTAAALPGLLREVDDPSPLVRAAVLDALTTIRPGREVVASAVVRALEDPFPEVRLTAVKGVGRSPRRDPELLPALMDRLNDESAPVRAAAAEVLGSFGEAAAGAVPRLRERLNDPDLAVRETVARVLANLGAANSGKAN